MSFLTPQALWKAGAGITAAGMTFGAFGSHSLTPHLAHLPAETRARSLTSWSTASSYLIYNGLGLLALSLYQVSPLSTSRAAGAGKAGRYAGPMILLGGVVFSGSIFGLVLWRERVGKVLGPVTPLGGLLFIAG